MKRKIILGAAIVTALALACLVLLGPRSPLFGFSLSRQIRFNSLEIRDTEESVMEKLGMPIQRGTRFLLPQEKGFEKEFERAKNSKARFYYLWLNGINWYYCVGFDEAGRLAVKSEGHS
jgi:hypothetical protein